MHLLLIETIALVGATVHTMEPGVQPIPSATIVIEDDRITAVGVDVDVPDGARIVDVAGLHLMPGLVDGYVTFDAEHDALYTSSGVTTVHDGGSPTGEMLMEKTASMRDRHPGPALWTTSPVFGSSATTRPGALVLGDVTTSEAQIDEVLGLVEKAGARLESVVFDSSILPSQHEVLCAAAKEANALALGPIPAAFGVVRAARNGQSALLGLDSLLPSGARFETIEKPDETLSPAVATLAQTGWTVIPLLMGTARILRGGELTSDPAVLPALGPAYEAAWRADLETFRLFKGTRASEMATLSLKRQRKLVKDLHDAGVPLVPGSGAASGGIAPGAGLIDELTEWAAAGIPAQVILHSATLGAATLFGKDADEGKIAAGYRANLIALSSDPLRSLEALRVPEMVVLRGAVRERFDLDDATTALIASQAASRAARSAEIKLERPPMPEGDTLLEGTLELNSYGTRTAVERYEVVRMVDGRMAYGARVRIIPTATDDARELVIVQIISENLVERFDLTLDKVDDDGEPVRGEKGAPGFFARGTRVGNTKRLAIERSRQGETFASQRTDEAIALIDGSSALAGLVMCMHARDGDRYFIEFDGALMEPVVDRLRIETGAEDRRLWLADSRGLRVFGFDAKGTILFGARAENAGMLDFVPGKPIEGEFTGLGVPDRRVFTGDPKNWNDPSVTPAEGPRKKDPVGVGSGDGAGKGDGK